MWDASAADGEPDEEPNDPVAIMLPRLPPLSPYPRLGALVSTVGTPVDVVLLRRGRQRQRIYAGTGGVLGDVGLLGKLVRNVCA